VQREKSIKEEEKEDLINLEDTNTLLNAPIVERENRDRAESTNSENPQGEKKENKLKKLFESEPEKKEDKKPVKEGLKFSFKNEEFPELEYGGRFIVNGDVNVNNVDVNVNDNVNVSVKEEIKEDNFTTSNVKHPSGGGTAGGGTAGGGNKKKKKFADADIDLFKFIDNNQKTIEITEKEEKLKKGKKPETKKNINENVKKK
jgi:hypothetical protein